LVLTDRAGVEVMARAGMDHARYANLYGCERDFLNADKPPVMPWRITESKRDIDVLFVGNLHPAVQRERLPWLGRISRLAERWNVVIRMGAFGNDYRHLLSHARIVFNRSIRGECNRRVFEGAAAGALLFQEDGNREVPEYFSDRRECVYYNSVNLESLLIYYLEHEDERRAIAEAARAKVPQFTFEAFWQRHLELIDKEWPSLCQRAERHKQHSTTKNDTRGKLTRADVIGHTWEFVGSSGNGDPNLARDLAAFLIEHPQDAELQTALGLVMSLAERGSAPRSGANAHRAEGYFRRAVEGDPWCLTAGLNLVETLVANGKKSEALEQARRLLRLLTRGALVGGSPDPSAEHRPWISDVPHYPPGFDFFGTEWERAAWSNAGDSASEVQAKGDLLRWRLQLLLADLTDDLSHFQEAALARWHVRRSGRPAAPGPRTALALPGRSAGRAARRLVPAGPARWR
jgi:hypothetical protein